MHQYNKTLLLKLMTFLTGILLPLCVFAQGMDIGGTVKDADGLPVIGAGILEKGTQNGTVTDGSGRFLIHVSGPCTLVVSSLSYLTEEIRVSTAEELQVVLKNDYQMLDEVMVIGYGTMKKKDMTGAVAAVGIKDIKDSPMSNIGQAIQGKVAGVQIIDSGIPGGSVNVKIRGLGSINNCEPLVVIDGIPTDLGLAALNVADIERLDILKDASSTAIYGSRGANGVIMVTTKQGKAGEGRVSVSADCVVQNAARVPTMLNAAQYAQLNNEMMENSGRSVNPDWLDPESLGAGTDWLDELLQTGIMQKYSLSYSGGNDKYNYYVSGGFVDQSGIVKNVRYQRFNVQMNGVANVKKWLKFSHNVTFSADVNRSGSYSIGDAMKALPVIPVKDEYGEWGGPDGNAEWYGGVRNPVGTATMMQNKGNGYNLLANISAEIAFTKWLKFKSTFGFDGKFWSNDSFTPKYAWKPIPVDESSRFQSENKSFTYLSDNYLTFDHTFARKHHVSAMVGVSAQWNNFQFLSAQKNGFLFDHIHEMSNGQEMYSIDGNFSDWALFSVMARANYSYADRYLITATVRHDGSSRFGKEHRWGTFPSVSLAWNIAKENWFPKTQWCSDLKLRAGYGVTGNQASVGNYSYLAVYDTGIYSFGSNGKEFPAVFASTLANPYVHWEEIAQANFGLDVALFNSRLMFSADAYIKDTDDMLVKASVPITSGFEDTSTTYANAGKVKNTGVELTLHSINFNKEFGWETEVSATYNRNRIIDLNSDVPYYINQVNNSYVTILQKGYPINAFYGYVTDGLFQNQHEVDVHAMQPGAAPGDIRFRDLNNDGVINDDDRTVLGSPNPNWLFSMNNRFTWKGLELSIYLQGVSGNKIYNANNIDNTGMSAAMNQTTAVLDRWTAEGTSNKMPRAVYGDPNQNCRVSDRFIENGSYLRLKNITLAYSFPSAMMQKIHLQNLRLYFTCENVATATAYSGFDPEVGLNGIDISRYPIPRTFSVGLNINF